MEANGANSKKDFRYKIYICKKESQETKHWLRMLGVYDSGLKEKIIPLWNEAQSLTMIFHKITNSFIMFFLHNANNLKFMLLEYCANPQSRKAPIIFAV